MIFVLATIKLHPGGRDAFVAAAKPAIEATRAEEGCIEYDCHGSVTDPDLFVFVERWTDRESLAAHGRAPHMQVFGAAVKDIRASRVVEVITPASIDQI